MSFYLSDDKEMEQQEVELSVMDVYDIASEIGKEFEQVMSNHGREVLTNLMPKVIYALEHLENFALRNEKENTTVQDLRDRIAKLELEKIEKAENQQRFERELEQIEEHWRSESRDLVAVIAQFQEENKRLRGSLADQKNSESSAAPTSPEVDLVVLQRIKSVVDNQREQIRNLEKELNMKVSELEKRTTQVERLSSTEKELRRKHKTAQNQVRTLIDERADFLAQLRDQQREINVLRQNLGVAEKENEDLAHNSLELSALNLKNKAVYDLDDPNRPRFTTSELKEILQERNELKAKVSDLEDELELYRPKNTANLKRVNERQTKKNVFKKLPIPLALANDKQSFRSHNTIFFRNNSTDLHDSFRSLTCSTKYEEEDAPVQGPLPYEPDDAPWKKPSDSYVRKFFRRLFNENNITFLGGSPKRSLSSLSKMALSATTTNNSGV